MQYELYQVIFCTPNKDRKKIFIFTNRFLKTAKNFCMYETFAIKRFFLK
jgi:hypothetical protein